MLFKPGPTIGLIQYNLNQRKGMVNRARFKINKIVYYQEDTLQLKDNRTYPKKRIDKKQ